MLLPVIPAEAGIHFLARFQDWWTVGSEKRFFVYIMASTRHGTLYIGVTSSLPARVWQHRNDAVEGFTKEHRIHLLVWFESHESAESAITREKQIKKWNRMWKIREIELMNPEWRDLYDDIAA